MFPRLAWVFTLFLLLSRPLLGAEIPTPEAHFGHPMGADRKLVEWPAVVSYFKKLAAASDRVRFDELGPTTEGRPFILLTVAAPETLAKLEDYQAIQARLADPRKTSPEEAEELIAEGKAVVLITCSIHSTEVASTMTAVEFLYRLVSEDTPRHRAILENTIFLLVPSLNPDGVDKVASWYKRYLGTPYEGAPMTELYQKYVGHDNNRDWYVFTQAETRLAVEKIHNLWRPQIVYDVHQMGSTGARIFVPPWIDPIDPNIDPLIVQQVNAFGMAMALDLTAAGKKGVVVHALYDYFTPARHYQSYHLGLRLLSESAGVRYATPIVSAFSSLQKRARGYNAQQSSWNFPEPWRGGEWTLRDIIDNQLITFESCLYNAALRREDLLRNFYRIGRRIVSRASPAAFVVPRRQHDPNAMARLLNTLRFGMVEIGRARREFEADGRRFREGDYVISMKQPYAAFAKTLLERQHYPEQREYPGGPPKKPYDVTAHTLPLLMGVEVETIEGEFEADLEPVDEIRLPRGRVADADVVALSPAWSRSFTAVNRLLAAGAEVRRDESNGDFYIPTRGPAGALLGQLAEEFGLEFSASDEDPAAHRRLRAPRVGLYRGYVPIMDEGWTRWVLEDYEFPYENIGNERIREGDLKSDFDVIILPDARPRDLHGGWIEGALYRGAPAPPRFTGGIGNRGASRLKEFLEQGGTLLAFNKAAQYAIERLTPPVENVLSGLPDSRFYSPGALLNVEVDTSHPLCFGMREREAVWFQSGPAFRSLSAADGDSRAKAVLSYPGRDVLASGWLLGEELLIERAAVMDVSVGAGRLVLFGIRPQYRAQPNATFKMVFNGLFYWRP